jgi:hypothetical protein
VLRKLAKVGRFVGTLAYRGSILVCEFRKKYGAKDVKKYSKFDVAVLVEPD